MLFFLFCVVSLLEEQADIDNDEQGEGGQGNQERGTTNNNNRPSHARKPKKGMVYVFLSSISSVRCKLF
jgi:hypothetical protein